MNNNHKQQLLKIGSLILQRAAIERKRDILDLKIQESRKKEEKIHSFLINQGVSREEMSLFLRENGIATKEGLNLI